MGMQRNMSCLLLSRGLSLMVYAALTRSSVSRMCAFGDSLGECETHAQMLPGEGSGAENVTCRNTAVVTQWNYFEQVTKRNRSSTSGGTDK